LLPSLLPAGQDVYLETEEGGLGHLPQAGRVGGGGGVQDCVMQGQFPLGEKNPNFREGLGVLLVMYIFPKSLTPQLHVSISVAVVFYCLFQRRVKLRTMGRQKSARQAD
jgi:hypothetical protein